MSHRPSMAEVMPVEESDCWTLTVTPLLMAM